jgi:hypothetical protein
MRLSGRSEKLGDTTLSDNFSTFEIGEPAQPKERIIRKMGKGSLALDAGKYFMLPAKGLHASFIEREDFAADREDSRHQVRFGQMLLNGPGVYESPDFVAVKPFDDRRELYNEWAANTYVNSVFDEQRAFLPLGIAKDKHGDTSLISLYEHGVKTGDTVFWADKDMHPEALREDVIKRAAQTSMYGLGLMHGIHLIHGDAQAKNLGWDNRHTRLIDLEGSILIPSEGTDQPEFTDKILKDVTTFIYSTMQVEENEDQIAHALRKPSVIQAMMDSYSAGIKKAKRQQEGVHVPDYAALHEEQIRHSINKTFK